MQDLDQIAKDVVRIKVDARGRMVIPQSVRERAGLEPDAYVAVEVDERGRISLLTMGYITKQVQELFADVDYSTEQYLRDKEEDAEAEDERFQELAAPKPRQAMQEAS